MMLRRYHNCKFATFALDTNNILARVTHPWRLIKMVLTSITKRGLRIIGAAATRDYWRKQAYVAIDEHKLMIPGVIDI